MSGGLRPAAFFCGIAGDGTAPCAPPGIGRVHEIARTRERDAGAAAYASASMIPAATSRALSGARPTACARELPTERAWTGSRTCAALAVVDGASFCDGER